MKNWVVFLVDLCLLCDEVFLPCLFDTHGFDIRAPTEPPRHEFFIFWIWHVDYRNIDETISGKQDGPSINIQRPQKVRNV